MPTKSEAWDILQRALDEYPPACLGDFRFISDWYPLPELAEICGECPVFSECKEYADRARPTGGVWSGRRYGATSKRKGDE